jgi:hypothetical protein
MEAIRLSWRCPRCKLRIIDDVLSKVMCCVGKNCTYQWSHDPEVEKQLRSYYDDDPKMAIPPSKILNLRLRGN